MKLSHMICRHEHLEVWLGTTSHSVRKRSPEIAKSERMCWGEGQVKNGNFQDCQRNRLKAAALDVP